MLPDGIPPSWWCKVTLNGVVLLNVTAPLVAVLPALERTLGIMDQGARNPADHVAVELRPS